VGGPAGFSVFAGQTQQEAEAKEKGLGRNL
jgi:hypothetical protein